MEKIIPLDKNDIITLDDEIVDVNAKLLKKQISLLILSVTKKFDIIKFRNKFNKQTQNIKFWIFVDAEADVNDLFQITWLAGNNIDPKRDSIIVSHENRKSSLLINALSKAGNKEFCRDWPNPVVMNSEIIKQVDNRWNQYFENIDVIPSPSLKYKKLMKNNGAFAFKIKHKKQ